MNKHLSLLYRWMIVLMLTFRKRCGRHWRWSTCGCPAI